MTKQLSNTYRWQWVSSLTLSTTLLVSGCATRSPMATWKWNDQSPKIVESLKDSTNKLAEAMRLNKQQPPGEEVALDGAGSQSKNSQISPLIPEKKKPVQKKKPGRTFAALLGKRPLNEIQDPFLKDQETVGRAKVENSPKQRNSHRVVSAETAADKEVNPFKNATSEQTRLDQLRKTIQSDQKRKKSPALAAKNEFLVRKKIQQMLIETRQLINKKQLNAALASAEQAQKLSEEHALFFGPKDDDPRVYVRLIKEKLASTPKPQVAATSQFSADPFLEKENKNHQTIKREKALRKDLSVSKIEKTRKMVHFAPNESMIIESRQVPTRQDVQEVSQQIRNQSRIVEPSNPTAKETEAPSTPVSPTSDESSASISSPVMSAPVVNEQDLENTSTESSLTSALGGNPFKNSVSQTELSTVNTPVLHVADHVAVEEVTESSENGPLYAPPARILSEEFEKDQLASAGNSDGPQMIFFTGDEVAANQTTAKLLNKNIMPPVDFGDSSIAPAVVETSSWFSMKLMGLMSLVALFAGFAIWKKYSQQTAKPTE